jgi:thymidylate synthase ThyX
MHTETSAKVIADSFTVNPKHRITTMEVTLHRFVLAEFNTHRVFSRNSASSRAIPVEKMLERFIGDPAMPLAWPAEQPGMQGGEELQGQDAVDARKLFNQVWANTEFLIQEYLKSHPDKSGRLHKSLINRLMEPFMWHTIIVTSTEWENFFSQRCSPLAQPEIRVAAEKMREAYQASTPLEILHPQWHTPYIREDEQDLDIKTKLMVSAARCARVSYLTHDGVRDIQEDINLFKRLMTADPPHWSPLEHVATPALRAPEPGNFNSWSQLRHNPFLTTIREELFPAKPKRKRLTKPKK